MAIADELESFGKEDPFRKDFLIPLLRRLGYDVVCDYHGTREFGRDIVFQEIDGFGQPIYHGLQAKYVDSLGQSDAHKLLEQCHEAFSQPFEHKSTGARHFISHLYIVNAGNISDNAERVLRDAYKGRVSLIDGKTIVQTDRWGTLRDMEKRQGVLQGLANDLHFNWHVALEIESYMRDFAMSGRSSIRYDQLRTTGLDAYLNRPIITDRFNYVDIQSMWRKFSEINSIKSIFLTINSVEEKGEKVSGTVSP
jgi:hypothetical protein